MSCQLVTATAIIVYPTGRTIDTDLCDLTGKNMVNWTVPIVTGSPFRNWLTVNNYSAATNKWSDFHK